jgi:hypothetical protein
VSPFLGTRGAGTNRAFGYAGAGVAAIIADLLASDIGNGRAFNNGRIDLSWTAPANNGATISGYKIERSTDGSSYSTLVANTGTTSTTYSDTSLLSNQTYYYKIAAINAAGTAIASSPSSATATTVPQAPTVSVTDVGTGRAYNNGAATVTVTPGATGGKAITSYSATSSGAQTASSSSTTLTITGLASGTGYTYTATATNSNGTSSASTASASVTATTVPQAPTIGTATKNTSAVGQLNAVFTPGATGGKAITSYTATRSGGTQSGSSSPIVVTGLTPGTSYSFTVTATNANGTSTASAQSNSVSASQYVCSVGSVSGSNCVYGASSYTTYNCPGCNGWSQVSGCVYEETVLMGVGCCNCTVVIFSGEPYEHTPPRCATIQPGGCSTCQPNCTAGTAYYCPSGGTLSGSTCTLPASIG